MSFFSPAASNKFVASTTPEYSDAQLDNGERVMENAGLAAASLARRARRGGGGPAGDIENSRGQYVSCNVESNHLWDVTKAGHPCMGCGKLRWQLVKMCEARKGGWTEEEVLRFTYNPFPTAKYAAVGTVGSGCIYLYQRQGVTRLERGKQRGADVPYCVCIHCGQPPRDLSNDCEMPLYGRGKEKEGTKPANSADADKQE